MRLLLRTLWFCNPQRKRLALLCRNYFVNLVELLTTALSSLSICKTL
jgi:hypothetical protein